MTRILNFLKTYKNTLLSNGILFKLNCNEMHNILTLLLFKIRFL